MRGIDVWRGSLDRTPEEISSLWSLLNTPEQHRAATFHRSIDSDRYIVARGTLRTLLGNYTSTLPHLVPLNVLPGGKPTLEPNSTHGPLEFNLSHCGDLALFAFADREVGIDVQRVEKLSDMSRIATHFFSPGEACALDRLDETAKAAFFFRTWVRKEAYLKARGDGLAIDPTTIRVGEAEANSVAVVSADGRTETDRRYEVRDLSDLVDHAAAIAFRASPEPLAIRFRGWLTPHNLSRSLIDATGV